MTKYTDLSSLISSRICHDLISPLGAIGNGVELLSLSATAAGPELALISESVLAANARIRFYRVAFGAAAADQRIGRPEVLSVLADITRGGRIAVDWQAQGDQPRGEVKLAFLLIQCLETAMPFGGRIAVTLDGKGWHLRGTAARTKVNPALWDVLSNPAAALEVSPAQVQFALVPEEVRRLGRSLSVELGEGDIRIGVLF
ncbi:MAG: histidine phosphotransferase [Rhodobacteraceae bacterium]|nr:histidine phosphotransferase [Paracoccaceae bacterium]